MPVLGHSIMFSQYLNCCCNIQAKIGEEILRRSPGTSCMLEGIVLGRP